MDSASAFPAAQAHPLRVVEHIVLWIQIQETIIGKGTSKMKKITGIIFLLIAILLVFQFVQLCKLAELHNNVLNYMSRINTVFGKLDSVNGNALMLVNEINQTKELIK